MGVHRLRSKWEWDSTFLGGNIQLYIGVYKFMRDFTGLGGSIQV